MLLIRLIQRVIVEIDLIATGGCVDVTSQCQLTAHIDMIGQHLCHLHQKLQQRLKKISTYTENNFKMLIQIVPENRAHSHCNTARPLTSP